MRSRARTLEALAFVLLKKIYPMKPALMRNDTLAASLVVQYVEVMLKEYNSLRGLNQNRTRLQAQAFEVYFKIISLQSLTDDTVRKYIAELWRSDDFLSSIKFEVVKEDWE